MISIPNLMCKGINSSWNINHNNRRNKNSHNSNSMSCRFTPTRQHPQSYLNNIHHRKHKKQTPHNRSESNDSPGFFRTSMPVSQEERFSKLLWPCSIFGFHPLLEILKPILLLVLIFISNRFKKKNKKIENSRRIELDWILRLGYCSTTTIANWFSFHDSSCFLLSFQSMGFWIFPWLFISQWLFLLSMNHIFFFFFLFLSYFFPFLSPRFSSFHESYVSFLRRNLYGEDEGNKNKKKVFNKWQNDTCTIFNFFY